MSETMNVILLIREKAVSFFRNYETIIMFLLKLFAGMFIFTKINSLGLYREEFAALVTFMDGFPYVLLLSILFAIAPPTLGNLIVLLAAVVQVSISIEVALIVFLLGVCVLVFYCRLEPQKSYLILAMLIAFYFNIPYAAVLFAGLYLGFSSIIPITLGTAVWNFIPTFTSLAQQIKTPEITDIADVTLLTDSFTDIYGTMQSRAAGDMQWIFTAFIFAMVVVLVYAVSRLTLNYAKEIAVVLGGVLCMLGYVLASAIGGADANIGVVVLFTIISVGLVLILKFFDVALDYNKVEYVQFEDGDNYYYVKIVNKLKSEKGSKAGKTLPRPVPSAHGEDDYLVDGSKDTGSGRRTGPK